MLKVDAYNHIYPRTYWDAMIDRAGDYGDLGKRTRSVPMLTDLDERFRVMDMFDEYKQILSLTSPPLEVMFSPEDAAELQVVANDGMAELCVRYPDRFPGFTASLAMNEPDAAVAEFHRAVTDLGALGVQIFTNVAGRALDNPEFFPIFEAAHALDVPMWMHPARGADVADYKDEERSKYEIWWTLGWPYETSVAQARMVFSGMMDKLPGLKIITHHLGGVEETECGLAYYPKDKVLFASDAPFDPEKGPMYIRETIKILDNLDIDDGWREDIYWRNAAKIMPGLEQRLR